MLILTITLIGLIYATKAKKGPYWVFLIPWVVCSAPISFCIINYRFFSKWDLSYLLPLISYLTSFLAGVWLYYLIAHPGYERKLDFGEALKEAREWSWVAWCIGLLGTVCILVDFIFFKHGSILNLLELRNIIVNNSFVSWFARLGSVLTWGCLYSFTFSLYYKEVLPRREFLLFFAPVFGYFLISLLTAGRQSSLQILIFAWLIQLIKPDWGRNRQFSTRINWAYATLISVIMVGYMGWIAVYRHAESPIGTIKTLSNIFDFNFSHGLESILGFAGDGVKLIAMEFIIYLTSPLALFSKFLTIDFEKFYIGVMSFPFLFRQLESITGVSVIAALQTKIELMKATGVTGVGWTTAISSYIMDFGRCGAAVVLFLQGFYTAYMWNRMKRNRNFNDVVIVLILFTFAIYMPLSAATGETNLFIMWLFCVATHVAKKFLPPNFKLSLQ